MKLRFKFMAICILCIIIIYSLPLKAFALDTDVSGSFLDPSQFDGRGGDIILDEIPAGQKKPIGNMIYDLFGSLLIIVRTIAVGWAIVMGIMIGVKYMMAAPQMKGQLKADLPTYFVGAAILFGSTGILTLINYFIKDYLD